MWETRSHDWCGNNDWCGDDWCLVSMEMSRMVGLDIYRTLTYDRGD